MKTVTFLNDAELDKAVTWCGYNLKIGDHSWTINMVGGGMVIFNNEEIAILCKLSI